MMQLRFERRPYQPKSAGIATNKNGKALLFDCPFCGSEVVALTLTLGGSGKLCRCGAKFRKGIAMKLVDGSEAMNADIKFVLETRIRTPGRAEVEVFAPDRFSFEGERHSLIAHGSTVAEAKETALADARSTRLERCKDDCVCKEDP